MSTKQAKQIDAVYQAGRSISNKEAVSLSDEELDTTIDVVTSAAISGLIQFSPEAINKHLSNKQSARAYCRGVVKNWLAKDIRLTGGVKYKPTNPGYRLYSKDSVIQELKTLRKEAMKTDDMDLVDRVDLAIKTRVGELHVSQ